jgi:protein O-mannosyl-transferase
VPEWFRGKVLWFSMAAVIAAVVLVYLPTLPYPFTFDDRTNIVENPALRPDALQSRGAGFFLTGQPASARYRPVSNASFLLNRLAGGPGPAGFRLVNIVIHALNILLVFLLFRRVLAMVRGSMGEGTRGVIALLAAGLWGASPLHHESVTYVVQRETSLSAGFFLLACLLSLKAWEGRDRGASRWLPAGAFGCFLLSAGAKETGFLLPFAVALLLLLAGGGGRKSRRTPLLLLAAGAALAAGGALLLHPDLFGWRQASSTGDFGPWERVLTQGRVLWWYAGLILLPLPSRQSIDVDFPASQGLLDPASTLVAWLAWAALAAWAWRGRRDEPLIALGLLWFLLLSSLEASPLHLEMAFIHRTYLPMLFLPLALVEGGWALAGAPWARKALAGAAAAVFLLFLGMTAQRNSAFATPAALWSDAVAKAPGKERPRFNLGRVLDDAGDLAGAETQYREAIKIAPGYYRPYANLAIIQERAGNYAGATAHMSRALDLSRGADGEVLYNMGRYAFEGGDHPRAGELFRQALATATLTQRGDAWWYLALLAEERRDLDGARQAWGEAAAEYGPATERGRQALERRDRLR